MPTFKHAPDSNVTLEPPPSSSHDHTRTFTANIYLAFFALSLLGALRLVLARLGSSRQPGRFQNEKSSFGPEPRKDSAASYTTRDSAVHISWAREQQREEGHRSQQAVGRAGPHPSIAGAREFWAAGPPQAMDDTEDDALKEDPTGSATTASRGISSTPRRHQNPPLPGIPSGTLTERWGTRSPSLQGPSSSLHGGGSDGASDRWSIGKGPMKGHLSWASRSGSFADQGAESSVADHGSSFAGFSQHRGLRDDNWPGSTVHIPRSSAALPLTIPTIGSPFALKDRRPSYAVSVPPELGTTFSHQPNVDYFGDATSTAIPRSSSPRSATGFQRSPTKGISIGLPIPTTTSSSSSGTLTSADTFSPTFSPSSYPPTTPLLPPPPPGQSVPYGYQFVGGPGGPGVLLSEQEVQLDDEVVSVVDGSGHEWKRHTRVYGGGICLACAAADDEGGFYGDTVPLEDRR